MREKRKLASTNLTEIFPMNSRTKTGTQSSITLSPIDCMVKKPKIAADDNFPA
jgi:hypothetical protein